MKFEIVEYELWGNAKEGYDVNSAYHTGRYIEVSEKCTNGEILEALNKDYELPENVSIFGDNEYAILLEDAEDGKPLLELHRFK